MASRPVDRRLLPRTFGSWFARFQGLTDVQRCAIPALMDGGDVLMCSATASGKTEAYGAPAAEIALAHGAASAAVVIVSPTRALANDLQRRLESPMSLVGLPLGRYTGEHKERVGGRLPAVVITTPEALDSILARRPQVLKATRMIVLDEIHVLDDTPRGDQLRVLLHRLEHVAARRPQRVAASATVDRPDEMARRYLRDASVVVVPSVRRILGRAFDGAGVGHLASHLEELAKAGLRKILVFCRSRNQVESYGTRLRGKTVFGESIFTHHGSLAKTARERTERLFQRAPAAVCFATLTLEMGIDIGTVDYVLLAGVPADVSSLLQRIGRGGRRGETTRAGFAVNDAAELHVFKTMFALGKVGRLCASPYGFRPSVVVQQALVMACAGTYVGARDVEACLPEDVRAALGPGACRDILDGLVDAELLERAGSDRFVPSETIERRYDRGTLHSNIDDAAGIEVVDRLTGDVLGTIEQAPSRHIEIGGKNRRVVKSDEERILTDATRDSQPARFRPAGSPSISLEFGRGVVEALGIEPGAIGLVMSGAKLYLLHGLGTIGALLLAHGLGRFRGAGAVHTSSPYTLELSRRPEALPTPSPDDVAEFLAQRFAGLEKLTAPGPWARHTPEALRRVATRRITGLDGVAAFLNTARLIEIEDPPDDLLAVLPDL